MNLAQLQYLRKKKGYSYEKLAELSKVPKSTVQKIFGGITKAPRYETLQALEKVLLAPSDVEYFPNGGEGMTTNMVMEQHASYNTGSSVKKGKLLHTLEDYYALPDEQRVELIDGVFYDMTAPRPSHQTMQLHLWACIERYIDQKGGKCVPYAAPIDVQLDKDQYTMVQPDVLVICDRDKITDLRIVGAPDLVFEILSPSTKRKDMCIKLAKYQNAGVREYWLVDLEQERVLVYDFANEDVQLSIYGFQDQVPVRIFDNELKIDFGEIKKKLI